MNAMRIDVCLLKIYRGALKELGQSSMLLNSLSQKRRDH